MESSLSCALRLNNEGVLRLLENRDQEAVTCFTQSLNLVKLALATSPEDDHELAASTEAFIHHATCPIPNLCDSSCFIYSNAIAFNLDSSFLEQCEQDMHVYSAVIILNIAMAYHRQAIMAGGGRNSPCRLKAEKMYDMVTTLVASSDDNHGTSLLVKIAAINNLSQMRHEQGDYDSSREGFEYLGALINFAESQLSGSLCLDETFKGMVLNVLLVTPPETAPAA